MQALLEGLGRIPLAGLLLVVTLGYGLGRLDWKGLSLGPAGGTLFCALALGHLGLPAIEAGGDPLAAFGFALFIYSVGFDAAPHFFSSFREHRGFRFVLVGGLVCALATLAALAVGRALGLGGSATAGMLAGALTSAPTYAAALEVAPDTARLAVSFALAYPFGLVGVVLLVQLLPRLTRRGLAAGARSDEEIFGGPRGPEGVAQGAEIDRAFQVQNPDVVGRSLRELDLPRRTGCVIARLRSGDAVLIPDADTVLEVGDRLLVHGRVDELHVFEKLVGPETPTEGLDGANLLRRRVQVRRSEVVGRSLEELRLIQRHHCVVTQVERGALVIEAGAMLTLQRDDVLEVVGRRDDLRQLAHRLGRFEPSLRETDIAVYAGGILVGVLVGAVRVPVAGFELGLGTAGGLLAVGLLLGARGRIGPVRTHVPREARQLVRDLGILLFVGETGLRAGQSLGAAMGGIAWDIVLGGVLVNVVAVGGALLVARRAMGLRRVDAWGSVSGGLTSSAALQAVRRASDSSEAAISYAAAYAVGSVLSTLAGPLVVLLLG